MNIKCNYCGSEFDETLEKCPSCGASNINVKRSTIDQPTTIEELIEWYSQRGLPAYETTRFFIGIDYKGPRAFGIYKDERSGKIIVYKNKDTGDRAVRYEGTDEAYAVNELFMRLKQEILEQKARNYGITSDADEGGKEEAYKTFTQRDEHEEAKKEAYYYYLDKARKRKRLVRTILPGAVLVLAIVVIFIATISSAIKSKPKYVNYGTTYSPSTSSSDTVYNDERTKEGYYKLGDDYYYHNGRDVYSWFVYNDNISDWDYVESSDVPESLKLDSSASPYSYTPDWEEESYVSDFSNTDAYAGTHHDSSEYTYTYDDSYSSKSDSWWSSSDDSWSSSDSSWDWGGSDSWDSGSTDWGSDW